MKRCLKVENVGKRPGLTTPPGCRVGQDLPGPLLSPKTPQPLGQALLSSSLLRAKAILYTRPGLVSTLALSKPFLILYTLAVGQRLFCTPALGYSVHPWHAYSVHSTSNIQFPLILYTRRAFRSILYTLDALQIMLMPRNLP